MAWLDRTDMQITPLVAYGLVFLGAVLAWLGLEKFNRAETELANKVRGVQTELATLQNLSAADEWSERLAVAMERRNAALSETWSGRTPGVIAAQLQQAIRKTSLALDYTQINIRVEPEGVDIDGISVLSFEFSGQAPDGKAIPSLLEGLAAEPRRIVVTELDFFQSVRDRRRPRVTLSGIVPITLAAGETSGGEGQP